MIKYYKAFRIAWFIVCAVASLGSSVGLVLLGQTSQPMNFVYPYVLGVFGYIGGCYLYAELALWLAGRKDKEKG